jgi:hypothetical protein
MYAAHIHLQSGKEHNKIDTYLTKDFKTAVTLYDIKAMLTYQYTSQYQSYDVWSTQSLQQYGRE